MTQTKEEFQEVKVEGIDPMELDTGESLSNAQDSLASGNLDDDSDSELTDLDSNFEFSSEEDDDQKMKLKNSKHRPVRRRGDRAIKDDTYDRTSAKMHQLDESKLTIKFNTETDHPTIKGETVPGDLAIHFYPDTVDWADKKSVSKLNGWRNQIFGRQIGPKNPARPRWTSMEMHFLCCIVQEHLKDVEGRYSKIDWEYVANFFNGIMDGRDQRTGEATAKSQAKGSHAEKKTWCLKQNRKAPVRSASAISAQIDRFMDPWPVKMLKDSRDVDKNYLQKELKERTDEMFTALN